MVSPDGFEPSTFSLRGNCSTAELRARQADFIKKSLCLHSTAWVYNKFVATKLTKEDFRKNAVIYKVMANAKRLEILNNVKDREINVNELSKILGTRKSNTSQHLMYLRFLGLVTARRQGKNIFYKIVDPEIVAPCKIFKDLREKRSHIKIPSSA